MAKEELNSVKYLFWARLFAYIISDFPLTGFGDKTIKIARVNRSLNRNTAVIKKKKKKKRRAPAAQTFT